MVASATNRSRPEPGDPSRAAIRARLRRAGPAAAADLRELIAVDDARRRRDEETRTAEMEGLVRIHEAMERLRVCGSSAELVAAAPAALATACGFSRVMVSQVRGSIWDPKAIEIRDDCDPRAERFRAYVRSAEIPLAHLLLEADLVRRRVPVLVRDPASDPRTHLAIVEQSRSTSFVAAPVMPTGRVIGFLHADRYGQERECDDRDREALWVFAEHLGLVYERTVLVERLDARRARMHEALAAAGLAIDELCSEELSLLRRSGPPAARREPGRPDPLAALLSPREREILDLLVTGASNAAIARRLVIAETTVKSHVRRILRKLHARTRVEAVARYVRIVGRS
ncbi:LuxR C-terminal-related transcriptional regulator [Patulibacter sp. NPDC049589]|uniref:LuxR C-terminal-related transcriptional regulator n=1 Tax=Patulibacter sp. NPDC049589 TaxID=3154731 RepID=UPI003420E79F